MGMSVGSGSNGRSRRGRRRGSKHGLMSEINVTPFVDVMLVLLIIFMVSAPLLVNGVPLDLPKSEAGTINSDKEPLTVSVDATGKLAINNEYYATPDELVAKLKALSATQSDATKQRIVVRGDKAVEYQSVLALLAVVQKAGFTNVALASLAQQ